MDNQVIKFQIEKLMIENTLLSLQIQKLVGEAQANLSIARKQIGDLSETVIKLKNDLDRKEIDECQRIYEKSS